MYSIVANIIFAQLNQRLRIVKIKIVIVVAKTLSKSQPFIQRSEPMATTETYQRCVAEIEIKNPEDLQDAIKELRQHYATMQYNDKTTIIEIWIGNNLTS